MTSKALKTFSIVFSMIFLLSALTLQLMASKNSVGEFSSQFLTPLPTRAVTIDENLSYIVTYYPNAPDLDTFLGIFNRNNYPSNYYTHATLIWPGTVTYPTQWLEVISLRARVLDNFDPYNKCKVDDYKYLKCKYPDQCQRTPEHSSIGYVSNTIYHTERFKFATYPLIPASPTSGKLFLATTQLGNQFIASGNQTIPLNRDGATFNGSIGNLGPIDCSAHNESGPVDDE